VRCMIDRRCSVLDKYTLRFTLRALLGIVRLPMNLIIGVRSEWAAAAAACRRALVAVNISLTLN
jgi:hypothetical protein